MRLDGNEIYDILKKRLIEEMPDDSVIADVAEEYAQQVKKAEDGGYIVATSLEQITEQATVLHHSSRPTPGSVKMILAFSQSWVAGEKIDPPVSKELP